MPSPEHSLSEQNNMNGQDDPKQQVYLYDKLREYCGSNTYPLHMPGHKRNGKLVRMEDPFSFDITEIEGFDNLHHPEDLLLEAQKRAADLYGSEEAFFLVNGSTAGILTAISTAADRGGKILMARNAHKSAYHAVYLNQLHAEYLWPEPYRRDGQQLDFGQQLGFGQQAEFGQACINGRIDPSDVEEHLREHPDISCVFIVSPTYDGVVSDVRSIAEIAHRYGAVLIVDEAHGAHLGFTDKLPPSAVTCGADLIIQSLHKTLTSLTQTALLHVNGARVNRERLRRFLSIYQTSSPSYVLMASIDECIRTMQAKGTELVEAHIENLEAFYSSVKDMTCLDLIRTDDPTKIIVGTYCAGLSGLMICGILRDRYGLEAEMAAVSYVLALTGVGDTGEGLQRLSEALLEIDAKLACELQRSETPFLQDISKMRKTERTLELFEAWDMPTEAVLLEQAAGRVAGEFLYLYPPGIPILVPGERVTEEILQDILRIRDAHYSLQGMADYTGRTFQYIKERS